MKLYKGKGGHIAITPLFSSVLENFIDNLQRTIITHKTVCFKFHFFYPLFLKMDNPFIGLPIHFNSKIHLLCTYLAYALWFCYFMRFFHLCTNLYTIVSLMWRYIFLCFSKFWKPQETVYFYKVCQFFTFFIWQEFHYWKLFYIIIYCMQSITINEPLWFLQTRQHTYSIFPFQVLALFLTIRKMQKR